jgi:hypothetical protein
MVTYAVVQFLLHVSVQFVGAVNVLDIFVSLNHTFLTGYGLCLSDIQQCQFELLQLTAGDAHQHGVQT